jgi:hypothetical protein
MSLRTAAFARAAALSGGGVCVRAAIHTRVFACGPGMGVRYAVGRYTRDSLEIVQLTVRGKTARVWRYPRRCTARRREAQSIINFKSRAIKAKRHYGSGNILMRYVATAILRTRQASKVEGEGVDAPRVLKLRLGPCAPIGAPLLARHHLRGKKVGDLA